MIPQPMTRLDLLAWLAGIAAHVVVWALIAFTWWLFGRPRKGDSQP